MRILSLILSLFLLCSCSDIVGDPFTTAGVGSLLRPAQNFPLGANSIMGYSFGGCDLEDATDHYWDFEPDDADDDYLWIANIDAMEASTYTLVAGVTYESAPAGLEYLGGMRTNALNESYFLSLANDPELRGSTASNDCTTMVTETRTDVGWAVNTYAVLAMTFAYSGNAGVGDSTKKLYVIRAGSTLVDTRVTAVGPINDCTGRVYIGAIGGLTADAWDGWIYWWAYYDSELTQSDLEDLFDGTKHPACDFTPVLYWDGSKAVAVTYTTEVGDYVMTVVGSPVQGP